MERIRTEISRMTITELKGNLCRDDLPFLANDTPGLDGLRVIEEPTGLFGDLRQKSTKTQDSFANLAQGEFFFNYNSPLT